MSLLRQLSCGPLLAASLWATEPVLPGAEYGFAGPEVIKLDWSTRSMNVRDFNQDGLNDIAVVNNDRSKIEILYRIGPEQAAHVLRGAQPVTDQRWVPVFEDAHYRREGVAVGLPVFDLVVGDMNADGRRVDLRRNERGDGSLSV